MDADGVTAAGNNGQGVRLSLGSSGNTVGGVTAADRNVITANIASGVLITDSHYNVVLGNYIGTNANGDAAPGNNADGVRVERGDYNTIGGSASGAGNVLSGNDDGIEIFGDNTGTNAIGNVVQGNLIGTDAAGTGDLGNRENGVYIFQGAVGNIVGGTTSGARNVISGNDEEGLIIAGAATTGNQVMGNYIGLNVTGGTALANTFDGISINDSGGNTIGGAVAGAGNVVSGNLLSGMDIRAAASTNNLVQGNLVGTDATGTMDVGNAVRGIAISSLAASNTIGGSTPEARNVISGNASNGMMIDNGSANLVLGNYIGTDITGTVDIGNDLSGLRISGGTTNNTIGGRNAGDGNIIAFNGVHGVHRAGQPDDRKRYLG